MTPAIAWPEGRRFAFTIFDDPDAQTLDVSREVYALLEDLGLRTTKAVWMLEPLVRNSSGDTCESSAFTQHCLELQTNGFEIGYHNGAPGRLPRIDTVQALDRFRACFGHDPAAMANHYSEDAIYWGADRLSGFARRVYSTVARRAGSFAGHVPGHDCFWGDLCQQRVRYCRNFVFRRMNTLDACPYMPYIDLDRQYVRSWYAASEGPNCRSFSDRIDERAQDLLEEQGGACIMYTHFGHGFLSGGRIDHSFRRLLTRLARRNGWFVPVTPLLDHIAWTRGTHVISRTERARLERTWLAGKLLHGTS